MKCLSLWNRRHTEAEIFGVLYGAEPRRCLHVIRGNCWMPFECVASARSCSWMRSMSVRPSAVGNSYAACRPSRCISMRASSSRLRRRSISPKISRPSLRRSQCRKRRTSDTSTAITPALSARRTWTISARRSPTRTSLLSPAGVMRLESPQPHAPSCSTATCRPVFRRITTSERLCYGRLPSKWRGACRVAGSGRSTNALRNGSSRSRAGSSRRSIGCEAVA